MKRSQLPRRRPTRATPWARKVKAFVRSRSRGRCEARVENVCSGRAEHQHHIILRSRGGPDEEWNLLDVCWDCHRWIHDNPAEATASGFMRSASETG